MRSKSALWLIIFLLLPFAAGATGEKWNDPHDYYLAIAQTRNDLLRDVEKYHLQPGIDKMNQNRYEYAVKEFDFILRYYPNHPRGLLLMSDLSLRMKKPEQAIKYFNKALSLFPGYAGTHVIYGIFLQKAGRLDDAVLQYEKALVLEPNASETHYNLGLALFAKGSQEDALKHAELAYQLGYPLPGLRNKLIKAGLWKTSNQFTTKPADQTETSE